MSAEHRRLPDADASNAVSRSLEVPFFINLWDGGYPRGLCAELLSQKSTVERNQRFRDMVIQGWECASLHYPDPSENDWQNWLSSNGNDYLELHLQLGSNDPAASGLFEELSLLTSLSRTLAIRKLLINAQPKRLNPGAVEDVKSHLSRAWKNPHSISLSSIVRHALYEE